MKPVSLDIPNSNDDLADWLTGHLLSRRLAEFVAELAAIRADSTAESHSLDEVLGSERDAVLAEGLGALPQSGLVQLLRRPTLLLDLQELVLADGGTLWRLPETIDDELQQPREAGWMRIRQEIDKQQWHTFTAREAPQPVVVPGNSSSPVIIILAIAVLALSGVVAWQFEFGPFNQGPVDVESWGWNRPMVSVGEIEREEYMNRLAEAANEWFDKRPLTRERLSDRIQQFRRGCGIKLREQSQYPPEDQDWLTDRFGRWAKSLGTELTSLEGGGDVIDVRNAVDELTKEIVAALRDRANE